MKNLFIILLVFSFPLIFSGCHQASHNNTTDSTTALQFDSTKLVKQQGNCNQPDSPCVEISLKYPVAKGGSDTIRNIINAAIQQQITKTLAGISEIKSNKIDSLVKDFIRQFNDFHHQFPTAPISQWTIEIKGKVINNNAQVISFAFNSFTYMGGAHPSTYYTWLNFDAATGQLLHWQNIVTDTAKVIALAEKKFRALHHISNTASLNSGGFMFDKDQFFLPENYLWYPDSLQFLYNDYEIAAYVYGPQRLTLTKEELDGLLKER